MKWAVLVVISAVALSTGAMAEQLVGRASVIDGDTIEIRGERVRLFGIDAPESGQICTDAQEQPYRCGQKAAFALDEMVRGMTVHCDDRGQDRYHRMIGVCRVNEVDLAGAMVRSGMALAYRRYSSDYVSAESAAQRDRAGMWQGAFEAPWDWRRR